MSIPNVPSLSKIINQGSEGGLEFARVMNQLLFEDSEICGYYFQSFSDSAGDYKGVDALMEKRYKKIGLQYKFFEGNPKNNKSDLKKSLFNAIDNFPDMDEWILVTPDNFTKHGMQWLDEIASLTNITVKHWGHSEILTFMLKLPQIGRKYYDINVFRNHYAYIDREPSQTEINNFFNQFITPEIDLNQLFAQAQPNIMDFKKIFSEQIYREVSDNYYSLYKDLLEFENISTSDFLNKDIRIYKSTIADMENKKDMLPGGMRMVMEEFNCFKRNSVFYTLKIGGMTSNVWCFVNSRWIFLPKPWRIIYSIYDLRNSKELNFLIKCFKWLGYGNNLNEKNSTGLSILANRIIHGLIK
ncbi:hypothetical protein [Tenacibaculum sp. 190524A05c]|uniref:hypothetical protein n=1 Tax=Tenacibaculum platacis TaxID=3137852 RepID=UPI0031FB64BD